MIINKMFHSLAAGQSKLKDFSNSLKQSFTNFREKHHHHHDHEHNDEQSNLKYERNLKYTSIGFLVVFLIGMIVTLLGIFGVGTIKMDQYIKFVESQDNYYYKKIFSSLSNQDIEIYIQTRNDFLKKRDNESDLSELTKSRLLTKERKEMILSSDENSLLEIFKTNAKNMNTTLKVMSIGMVICIISMIVVAICLILFARMIDDKAVKAWIFILILGMFFVCIGASGFVYNQSDQVISSIYRLANNDIIKHKNEFPESIIQSIQKVKNEQVENDIIRTKYAATIGGIIAIFGFFLIILSSIAFLYLARD